MYRKKVCETARLLSVLYTKKVCETTRPLKNLLGMAENSWSSFTNEAEPNNTLNI